MRLTLTVSHVLAAGGRDKRAMDGARPSQDMDVLPRGKRPPADRARRPTGPLRLAENLVVVAATIGTTRHRHVRSEEHPYEHPSLMRISYAVFCLKQKNVIDVHKIEDTCYDIEHMT